MQPFAVSDVETAWSELLRGVETKAPYQAMLLDTELAGSASGGTLESACNGSRISAACQVIGQGFPSWAARSVRRHGVRLRVAGAWPSRSGGRPCSPPFAKPAIRPPAGAASPLPPRARTRPTLRILQAEDGPVNQEVAVGLLEMRGHRVTVAENGQEALERLAADTFDVVLMDLGNAAFWMASRLRAAFGSKKRLCGGHLPIIAMTAHALQQFRDDCHNAGMDGYVTKPIQPAELEAALDEALVDRLDATTPADDQPPPLLKGG